MGMFPREVLHYEEMQSGLEELFLETFAVEKLTKALRGSCGCLHFDPSRRSVQPSPRL